MSNPNKFMGSVARHIPTVGEKAAALMQRLATLATNAPVFPISEIYIPPQLEDESPEDFNARRLVLIANTQAFFALNYATALYNSLGQTANDSLNVQPNVAQA